MSIEAFIARWSNLPGGAERANFQGFIYELVDALGLDKPDPAEGGVLGTYQFDGPIPNASFRTATAKGFADLYKRGSFVMEAKQSYLPPKGQRQPEIFDHAEVIPLAPSGAAYDKLMIRAQGQAKNYAVNLPADHPSAPFLIVCDIGRAFDIYYDHPGNGRGYGFFPDKQSYRIPLAKLREPETQALFRDIWNDPRARDPKLKAAEVTRDVSFRLAQVAKALDAKGRAEAARLYATGKELSPTEKSGVIEDTSLFLMRLLFCMFAEDIGLLPKGKFTAFLESAVQNDAQFEHGLTDLWTQMDKQFGPRWSWVLGEDVRYFNGGLFENKRTYRLLDFERGELLAAARRDWKQVEPAIFGTLLEQALTDAERAKLGAHYTPRAYVERLVEATIMDVLNAEWAEVQDRVTAPEIDADSARHIVHDFHDRIAALRILDPACGTGNFLYVAMEALEQLEAQVIEVREQLGDPGVARVGPHQFFGLEKNLRAAKIAELVLWIGWLRFRIKNDPDSIIDPVLARGANINFGRAGGYDAVLDEDTGLIPDWPAADFIIGNPPFIGAKYIREQLGSDYAQGLWRANPRVPKSADFVMQWWDRAAHILVAKDTRLRRFGFVTTNSITQEFSRRVIANYLKSSPNGGGGPSASSADGGGERQVELAPQVRGSSGGRSDLTLAQTADAHAAGTAAPASPARPSTTPQEGRGPPPLTASGEDLGLSLVFAIPDHPWIKAVKSEPGQRKAKAGGKTSGGPAAVRIAMTVAQAGVHEGRLVEIVREAALDSDAPQIEGVATVATIHADLTVGTDATFAVPLKANEGIASPGVKLHGAGFIVTPAEAAHLGLGRREGLEAHIRPYRHGRDLLQRSRGVMVIDLFGLDEKTVRTRFPEVYQHVLSTVKPERDENRRVSYRDNWWIHGEARRDIRPALNGLSRFIATPVTAKYRIFLFVEGGVLPDDALIAFGSDDPAILGILSSLPHVSWTAKLGGTLENRERYNKSLIFDPFPFPDATPDQRAVIAELAEELDATRKLALAEVPGLTMTEIYNLRGYLKSSPERGGGPRSGGGGSPRERVSRGDAPPTASPPPPRTGEDLEIYDRAMAARVGIIDRLHDQIDEAVAAAYGWPATLSPSEIVARLVALNATRAAEEKAGHVRWLRPDYQVARFGGAG